MTHQNRKKGRNFKFLNAGCSLLRAEGFSNRSDVLYGGLGKSKLHFFFFKKILLFLSCNFFSQFFVIKTLDLDQDQDLNPHPH
jgi:hypothetical protein